MDSVPVTIYATNKNRNFENERIDHYSKIIKVLNKTGQDF